MNEMNEIIELRNKINDHCEKYCKEIGDCYLCPIGKRIKEYCKVNGVIRFLDHIIDIEKEKSINPT